MTKTSEDNMIMRIVQHRIEVMDSIKTLLMSSMTIYLRTKVELTMILSHLVLVGKEREII